MKKVVGDFDGQIVLKESTFKKDSLWLFTRNGGKNKPVRGSISLNRKSVEELRDFLTDYLNGKAD